jgi:hypothetical protein
MKKSTSSSKDKAKPTPAPAKAVASKKTVATKPVAEKAPTAAVKVKSPAAPKAVKAPKAVAPKAVAPKEPVATPVATTTTIVASIDIGFGNQLFVRGEGAGLSWDRGILLQNVAADKWQVSLQSNGSPLTFKFLVNDLTWNFGDDYVVEPGSTVSLTPVFS